MDQGAKNTSKTVDGFTIRTAPTYVFDDSPCNTKYSGTQAANKFESLNKNGLHAKTALLPASCQKGEETSLPSDVEEQRMQAFMLTILRIVGGEVLPDRARRLMCLLSEVHKWDWECVIRSEYGKFLLWYVRLVHPTVTTTILTRVPACPGTASSRQESS
jgi:hypothetical protein